jgi:hypothetical protein
VFGFWVTSRVEKQYNDKLLTCALGLVHKRFLFSISSKRAKEEEANDQKVGSLRNETHPLPKEHTFSCTFHDKHSSRKTASKQASKA